RRVWQTDGLRTVDGVVRVASGEHPRGPLEDPEGGRPANAAVQPEQFPSGRRPGSGGADRTLRDVEQFPRLAVAPMALAHAGVVRRIPVRVSGDPLTGRVGKECR